VDAVNELDVVVDQHLTFLEHIDRIAQKAASRCYVVSKCFQSRNTEPLVRAFKTYVRPLLKVNSPVWLPQVTIQAFLGRLLGVDLIKCVSNVRPSAPTSVRPSVHKKFLRFQ